MSSMIGGVCLLLYLWGSLHKILYLVTIKTVILVLSEHFEVFFLNLKSPSTFLGVGVCSYILGT